MEIIPPKTDEDKVDFYSLVEDFLIEDEDAFDRYLTDLWKDLSLQSKDPTKGISREAFRTYYNIPELVNKTLFELFNKDKKGFLSLKDFKDGMKNLYLPNFDNIAKTIFDLFDYDKNGWVNKEDIQLVMSYIPLEAYKNTKAKSFIYAKISFDDRLQSQEEIFKIIQRSFRFKVAIDFNYFKQIIEEISSDIFIYTAMMIYEQRPFNSQIIELYSDGSKKDVQRQQEKWIIDPSPKQRFHSPHLTLKTSPKARHSLAFKYSSQFSNSSILKDIKQFTLEPEPCENGTLQNVPYYIKKRNYKTKDSELSRNTHQQKKNDTLTIEVEDVDKDKNFYSGHMFKITKENKMKIYFFKLIMNDLFYFSNKNDKKPEGMHHLSGVFLEKSEERKKFKEVELYSFILIYPNKVRKFYLEKESELKSWLSHIGKAVDYLSIEDSYTLGEVIAKNKSVTLRKGVHNKTQKNVIVKITEKKKLNETDKRLAHTCFDIAKISQHIYLERLLDGYEDNEKIYLVFEGEQKIDLFCYLDHQKTRLSEPLTARVIHELLCALYYLHSFGVLHRNIKPENILMTSKENNADIKLVDFYLSKVLRNGELAKESYGTLSYVSPEILLEKPYKKEVDMWCVGVVTFLLIAGFLPFDDEHSEREIARQTIFEAPPDKDYIWSTYSNEVKDFVFRLLEKKMDRRMTVQQALIHPWIEKYFKHDVEVRKKCEKEKKCPFKYYCRINNQNYL